MLGVRVKGVRVGGGIDSRRSAKPAKVWSARRTVTTDLNEDGST